METKKITFINRIVDVLHDYNIVGDVAVFIACQFAFESSFGCSELAIKYNNFCGMKLPVVRRSTAINFGSSDKWSHYSSVNHCVDDYVLCLMYHHPLSGTFDSVGRFKYFLNSWYCPSKSYLDIITSLYVQFKNQLKNGN